MKRNRTLFSHARFVGPTSTLQSVSQAYAMFGSATKGLEGYNEKLSNYTRERTVADNAAQSRRQAVEANTDSQVGRKQEWSRGIGAVPIVGPPSDIIREGISGIVSSASDGKCHHS